MRSCKNQFYYDLITPLPDKLDVPGTQIHIFYALKMGEKYRERYRGTLPSLLSMSRTCSMRSCWPAIRRSGHSS